jgi:16S rRNA (cytosine967-C5)-methyltransferase
VALARANNEPAPASFRFTARTIAKDGEASRIIEELSAAGVAVQQSKITPDAWRVNGQRPALLRDLANAGKLYLQDEASQLVAHFLDTQAGDRVVDLCAAPGSKTTHISALAPGATIVAADLYEHRLRILRELATAQDVRPLLVGLDANWPLPFLPGSFDRVLVDAPCSGTGTLRHNPEIRWRLSAADITELAAKQSRILNQAAELVRPGGRLVYSTCSLESEENESVAKRFASAHSEFERLRLAAPLITDCMINLGTETGAVRTWPHLQDVDGFFMIAFQRRV